MHNKIIYLITYSLVTINFIHTVQASTFNGISIFEKMRLHFKKLQLEEQLNKKIDEFVDRIKPDDVYSVRNYINIMLQYSYEQEYCAFTIDMCKIKSFKEVIISLINEAATSKYYGNKEAASALRELKKIISRKNKYLLTNYDFLLLFRDMLKLKEEIEEYNIKNRQK